MNKYYRIRGVTELPSLEIVKIEYGGYARRASYLKHKAKHEIKRKYGVDCDIVVLEEIKESYLINKTPNFVKSTIVDTCRIMYDVRMLNNLLEDSKRKLNSSKGSDDEEFYRAEVDKYTKKLQIEIAAWEYPVKRVPVEE